MVKNLKKINRHKEINKSWNNKENKALYMNVFKKQGEKIQAYNLEHVSSDEIF